MDKEIVRAAIKVNGKIYIGFDHGECFKQIDEHTVNTETLVEGFVDNEGNFVDRKQAMIIAKEAGQLQYETDKQTLISEDLHIDWLNKQTKQLDKLTNLLTEQNNTNRRLLQQLMAKDAEIIKLRMKGDER